MKVAIRAGLATKRYMNIDARHYSVKFGKILPLCVMLTPANAKIKAQKPEYAEIMLFLRQHLLSYSPKIVETFKYMTLYYEYKNKGICYMHLKDNYVYLGFTGGNQLKHAKLHKEGRKYIQTFKCFINEDIDVKSLNQILKLSCLLIDKSSKV